MKLYFMKQNALETIKGNLPDIFTKYFTETSNEWLWKVCGENPFAEFMEIPDFSLSSLDSDLSKGEIDMENCKIIYKHLMFVSESQASDERLWAGLTHSVFYDYMRNRWGYDVNPPKSPKKTIGEIKTRYFFEGGARGGFYRNTMAKCWWVGRALYDKTKPNPFYKLDIIGSNDLSTKITDIFYSNTYSSNTSILNGIVKCFDYFNKNNVKLSMREQVRPTLQLLNAIGGGIVLDCLSTDDIADIMIENIEKIIQGDNANIKNIDDDYIDDEDDNINQHKEIEINDDIYVTLGCRVVAAYLDTREEKTYLVDYSDGALPLLVKNIIGLKIGDHFSNKGRMMEIINISI